MSGGQFEIKFFEPGALIPPLECFDAVSKGSIESCWTTPGYHTGKYPALAFFTTVPFGPNVGEFLAWKWFGGGNKLREEIYAKHGMTAVDCFCIGPETSGWFRKEVKSLNDLKGMKMRFFGLGAQVMQKLGVSTQLLAAADIYPALERGVIDATEFSMPMMDIKLGFHQIAKFNYFPGWHQQVSCSEFLMNKAAYDKLPAPYKAMIEVAGQAQVIVTLAESEAAQFDAMAEMRDKHKVQVKRWDDKTLAAFEKAWLEVLQGGVGQGRDVQEGRRPLPRLPQALRHLGRRASAEADLPERQTRGRQSRAEEVRRERRRSLVLRRPSPLQRFGDAMNALLKVSESLRRLLEWIALASGWLLVIMACVTTFDVVARKFGLRPAVHQAAGAGVALPRRDLLAVDGLLLHHQRASARRFLHRAA